MAIMPIARKMLALLCGAGFLCGLSLYPLAKTWLIVILPLYALLLAWRPHAWLFALPALLPVLDLAPWTGWFFFEETDLLLLLTAAFVWWRLGSVPVNTARLAPGAAVCLALVTLAWLAGIWRGLQPLPPLDADSFTSYLSPYNSLRTGKTWLWAMILLPPLQRAAGARLDNIGRYVIPGILCGLLLVAGADILERARFPGLANFAADYRTSAPFSGMHLGGATLDGYLALCLPFIAAWLPSRSSRLKTGAAALLLVLVAYAGMTTFSRGLYAAYACALLLLGLFLLHARIRNWRRGAAGILLWLIAGAALVPVFASSGYRGLLAAALLLLGALLLATLRLPWRLLPASACCALLAGTVFSLLPPIGSNPPGLLKPPYLFFMLSGLLFAGTVAAALRRATPGSVRSRPDPLSPRAAALALASFAGLGYGTVWIGLHWGGGGALLPGAGIAALAAALIIINHAMLPRLWRLGRDSLALIAAGSTILMLVIPIGAGYYTAQRFSTTAGDLDQRLRHWRQALAMMDGDSGAQLLGMGLGSFPRNYYWHNAQRDLPAAIHYIDQAHNRYLLLEAPRYAKGYGELLRLLQRVPLRPYRPYTLALDVRHGEAGQFLHLRLCERQLLYPQNCLALPVPLRPADGQWHRHSLHVESGPLGSAPWPLAPPVQLELAAEGGVGGLAIDNLSLLDEISQRELLHNGDFSQSNNYWFFSSDRHHLPWHIKNLGLNLFFELGWLGLGSMVTLLLCAVRRQLPLAWSGQRQAAIYLAALAGFLTVGLFDSLIDAPRLALMFFLVLLCALLRPAPPVPGPVS